MDDEARILEGCRRRAPEALRAFALSHYDRVHRMARALAGDPHLAEDLTQETFVEALGSLPGFRGDSSPTTWLATILRRRWLRWLERRGRLAPQAVASDLEPTDPGPPGPSWEDRHDLSILLERLAPEDRLVLELFHLEGLSYRDLAVVLEAPIGTVKRRLHEARASLREEVQRHAM